MVLNLVDIVLGEQVVDYSVHGVVAACPWECKGSGRNKKTSR